MIKWPLVVRRVEGHSMEPSLKEGQIIYATPLLRAKKGDIVIARPEGREIIKRVSQVSPRHLFLAGDNTDHSRDSRIFGEVEKSKIVGKVLNV